MDRFAFGDKAKDRLSATLVVAAGLMAASLIRAPLHRLLWAADGESATEVRELRNPGPATHTRVLQSYGRLPLTFEANQGQTDSRVKFLARGAGYTLFLTQGAAVLQLKDGESGNQNLARRIGKRGRAGPSGNAARRPSIPGPRSSHSTGEGQRTLDSILSMRLVGGNAAAPVTGDGELSGKSNYFIGSDRRKWRTNIPNYANIQYHGVYPGIDLVYYGNQGQLEWDFVVAPGADPRAIRLAFAGARSVHIERTTGDLVLRTGKGFVRLRRPAVYQSSRSRAARTQGHYKLTGRNQVALQLPAYDASKPLVIDPVLSYSTFLGGSDSDYGRGITVDASGDAYVVGGTSSINFPTTPGAYQTQSHGAADAFITKLNPEGSALVYSTYLGGSSTDGAQAIAVDTSGAAYVTGYTCSSDFPTTPGAFQTIYGGGNCVWGDAFMTKLSPTGSALTYSTISEAAVARLDSASL